jgi:pheromone shutdown protein TraB
MLAEMTGEFPALSNVFVRERDTYLAYSLWLAASPIPNMNSLSGITPAVVVGVVGIGHVPGIVKQWGTVTNEDIPPLLKYFKSFIKIINQINN